MGKVDWEGTPFGHGRQSKAGGSPRGFARPKTDTNELERMWAEGRHMRGDGSVVSLSALPQPYLRNILGKYQAMGVDTSALGLYLQEDDGSVQG